MSSKKGLITRIGEWLDEKSESRTVGRFLPSMGNVIFTLLVAGAIILTQNVWATPAQIVSNNVAPSATNINYQGRLADDNGLPLTGNYTVEFAIYDAPTNGNLIWGTETHANMPVSDGLFNVGLGSLTSGGIPTNVWSGDRYLQVTVEGEPLTPRELIRSVPVAGMALTALSANTAMTTTMALNVPDGSVSSAKLAPMMSRVSAPETLWLTTEWQTVATTQVTVDTPSRLWIVATCDCNAIDGALTAATMWVDGLQASQQIMVAGAYPIGSNTDDTRFAVSNTYVVDVGIGTHTIDLKAKLADATGSGKAYAFHTGFSYFIVSQ